MLELRRKIRGGVMKLSRVILAVFITLSAIYVGAWVLYGILKVINRSLDKWSLFS